MTGKNEHARFMHEVISRNGNWPCSQCSNENWTVYHLKHEDTCPNTGFARKEVEYTPEQMTERNNRK
jgi:hypothetical protein